MKQRLNLLKKIWADAGYQSKDLTQELANQAIDFEVVKRPRKGCWVLPDQDLEEVYRYLDSLRGFHVLPRRWVVERTFGWFNRYRRLSKDYEYLPKSSDAFIYLSMSRLMASRMNKMKSIC